MAVNPVTTGQSGLTKGAAVSSVATAGVTTTTANVSQTVMVSEAVVYEKSDQTQATAKTGYTMDTTTLNEIAKQVEAKFAYLRATVENLFSMQSVKTGEAQSLTYEQIMEKYNGKLKEFCENLEVDEKTSLAAQQEIAEDGFWGVKQTGQRAIEFAIALSGGDTSKAELLKNAIIEGYKAAESAWGGELPEICKQTQEAMLKGLDEWAKPTTQTEEQLG